MARFLILQLRPEDDAADGEFAAFLDKGGLSDAQVHRIRLDQTPVPAHLDLASFAGIILGGGPGCVSDDPQSRDPVEARMETDVLALLPQIVENDLPFLGCCAGIGLLAHFLGAPVSKARFAEPIGPTPCYAQPAAADDPLLSGLPKQFDALVGHKEAVQDLPEGCVHLLAGPDCPFQMIRYGQNVYATQFHPEADGAEFERRIHIYKSRGYFDPDDAERLIAICQAAEITVPEQILEGFVSRYG